jgi:CheY-like chemotaxis protein
VFTSTDFPTSILLFSLYQNGHQLFRDKEYYWSTPPNRNMFEPKPYILLIDDDQDDLDLFSSGLQGKGMEVKTFDSSTKALFYLTLMSETRELPSFIIMDYNMPKKNGHQVLLLIKNNAETKHIPVVMYSTSMADDLRQQLIDAGAFDCFIKPWTGQELNTQVELFKHLNNSFLSKEPA